MDYSKKTAVLFSILITTFIISGCSNAESSIDNASANVLPSIVADKIEVVHFHATQQCVSCITVGKFALKTVEQKFPEEYKNGKIIFKDINGELPENYDIVAKYQARGSSLFVNAIVGGENHIEEDIKVWRLIGDEKQFVNYFEGKLNKLLGK